MNCKWLFDSNWWAKIERGQLWADRNLSWTHPCFLTATMCLHIQDRNFLRNYGGEHASALVRCIRVVGFWCLKSCFSAQKCARKVDFYKPYIYLGCIWKWIRSHEQNFVSESRRASLYSVKVIKMPRLTIDRLFLWSLHQSLHCCETDRETDCTTFFSLDTQDVEKEKICCTRNPCVF